MKTKETYQLRSHFPWKRCIIASIVILLCSVITIALIVPIRDYMNIGKYNWIIILVWSLVFGGLLLFFWIKEIIKYQRKRKDEK